MKGMLSACVTLMILASTPALAEIEVASSKTKQFDSPMVLTVDFPVTESSRWGQGEWLRGSDYASLPAYVCDHVSIKNLQVAFEPSKNGKVRVIVRGTLAASEGHDKAVDLNLELVNSDIVVGTATEEIKIEEEQEEKWKTHMDVTPLALNTTPGPKLRISMSVEDD